MTKRYDIIHIDNHMSMIDKREEEAIKPVPNKHHICLDEIRSNAVPENKDRQVPCIIFHDDPVGNCGGCREILASTDKSLGLPLLPSINQNIENIAEKLTFEEYPETISGERAKEKMFGRIKFYEGIIRGLEYSSTKKYTEKDLKTAIQKSRVTNTDNVIGTGLRLHRWTEDEIIQYLNPKPIAVEVEMYQNPDNDNPNFGGYDVPDTPKVDENNFVIVNKWIYE